jgi:GNAT superfamily N-acetyltransferase
MHSRAVITTVGLNLRRVTTEPLMAAVPPPVLGEKGEARTTCAAGTVTAMQEVLIRAVRPDEWERLRDFRLEALRDDAAQIAFLASLEEVAAQPDELWQRRAIAGSEAAEGRISQRTFVADQRGMWLGTATVLITEAGETDFTGRVLKARVCDVVAVYVTPSARGAGVVQRLLDSAAAWVATQELVELQLYVNAKNGRAQRAYEKCGFRRTGDELRLGENVEHLMVLPVPTPSLTRAAGHDS